VDTSILTFSYNGGRWESNLTLFAKSLLEEIKRPSNIIFFEAAKIFLQAA